MPNEPASPHDVTQWLAGWQAGDGTARERLFDMVYPELRRIATRHLRRERPDHTLDPHALANELCVRLLGTGPIGFNDRAHFFAVAAQMMRRILIDYARARPAEKRGGSQERVTLSAVEGWNPGGTLDEMLDLDQALATLHQLDPRAAQVVELRFFGGLEGNEIAAVLGVSPITVKRDWKAARAWLVSRLQRPS